MFYNPYRMDVSTFGPPVLKAIQTNIGTSLSELNKINPKIIAKYVKVGDQYKIPAFGI